MQGICCKEHSSFILSWNLIGDRETKVIMSQKSFPGWGSQTLFSVETSDSRKASTPLLNSFEFYPLPSKGTNTVTPTETASEDSPLRFLRPSQHGSRGGRGGRGRCAEKKRPIGYNDLSRILHVAVTMYIKIRSGPMTCARHARHDNNNNNNTTLFLLDQLELVMLLACTASMSS